MVTTEQDNFKTGEIFYHYKNLKPYIILGFCKIQEKIFGLRLYFTQILKHINKLRINKRLKSSLEL